MKYRWNAKQRHGVHSPFVYELTDKCFRSSISDAFVADMEALKKRLQGNQKSIEITDHGAGSKRMGNTRTVHQLYKNSSSKGKYGKMLFQLMRHYKLTSALELGTSVGIGSAILSTGNPKATITTIEGCPNTRKEALSNFKALKRTNIRSLEGTFSAVVPTLPKETYDLIFIDGHHDGPATLNYVEMLLPHAHADTFFILDDIRWSDSMKLAWEQLKNDDRFHVTIDLFRMGMILLRPQQEKEHFDILL
ncbi:MAG: class I SAM-dependent methyltransferase [bacterium]|nr:class I SAM-dependent methyltransferase [bacterium]